MLEDSLIESRGRSRTQISATLISSAGIHFAAITVLALIPLLQIHAVPVADVERLLPVPGLEKLEPITLVPPENHVQLQPQIDPNAVITPHFIPKEIAYVVEQPSVPFIVPLSPGATTGVGSILRELANRQPETEMTAAPPAPVQRPAAAVAESEPIRRGGTVQQANLIHQVLPVYPSIARQVRVQGIVVLEAVISKEGTIESLRVVSGHPLLIQSAIDAVKQWIYRPTLLNGLPVEVITTITVSFSLK